VNSSTNSFDLRAVVGELKDFVTSRNWDSKASVPAPSASQVELAILSALVSGPKNAQQLMPAVSVASAGTLTVTQAQVHPALSNLEAAGQIESATNEDRKLYSVTQAGIDALKAATEAGSESTSDATTENPAQSKNNSAPSWLKFDPEFLKAASKLAPVISDLAKTGTRSQQEKATQILQEARHQLHKILAED
jgi:DNA-binding PadR family transcriptional regulator